MTEYIRISLINPADSNIVGLNISFSDIQFITQSKYSFYLLVVFVFRLCR